MTFEMRAAAPWAEKEKLEVNSCPSCRKPYGVEFKRTEAWTAWRCEINVMGERGILHHGCDMIFLTLPGGGRFATKLKAASFDRRNDFPLLEEIAAAFIERRAKDLRQIADRKADDLEEARLRKVGEKRTCVERSCPRYYRPLTLYGRDRFCSSCGAPAVLRASELVKK